ncbi:unnamed protein product [Caenorhabditis sp. 36 PRJEB53466]|nr:unnamed protein product [Caenorhabditis sp. 36 PRJEB53466]
MRLTHLVPILFVCFSESALFSRNRRQISVSSNAETDGDGDQVLTDASTLHFKDDEGVVGMNVTALGNSSGNGSTAVGTTGGGSVGNSSVENVGNVMAVGDKSNSFTDIFAAVQGENITSNLVQQGKVVGQGATLSNVNGGSTMQNNSGEKKSGSSYGNAGGTGSINSQAEIRTEQAMSWQQLMAKLTGSVSASGLGSAQSNIDMGTGVGGKNMTISGLVSGLNSEKGTVNALVNGNGTIDGDSQYIQGMMVGSSSGKGNSTLVGASSINSNQSSNSEVQAFGNANAYSSGNSSVNLISNTNIGNNTGLGVVHIGDAGQGANNYIVASNGLKLTDSNQEAAIIGSGVVKGIGSVANSKAAENIDTAIDSNGIIRIQSESDGQSISNDGTNSSLSISSNALVGGYKNSSYDAMANGYGVATGEKNNVTGVAYVDINGVSLNGNSSMMAFGSGNGPVSADTKAVLNLNENGVQRNGTVAGSASGNGNNTNVESYSLISNDQGVQTLTNIQHVLSTGSGSSSVSASSSGIFKRKKRFSILADMLKK